MGVLNEWMTLNNKCIPNHVTIKLEFLVQAARPNPTQATPTHKLITDKPIIKVPGCPPIAEVMTGVITYMVHVECIRGGAMVLNCLPWS
jgi:hypothetical protein